MHMYEYIYTHYIYHIYIYIYTIYIYIIYYMLHLLCRSFNIMSYYRISYVLEGEVREFNKSIENAHLLIFY